MPKGEAEKVEKESDGKVKKDDDKNQDRTIEAETNAKDDCSDLTDNNEDTEEQAPKSFPQKLLEVLSNEEHTDVISWLPHGNGFIINKKKTFANDILPKYFKATKFTSFTRKLNRWGFSRAPRGPETGAYFHKLFRRDKPELSLQMTSNSGNKYQSTPMQQHLMPNVAGMMPTPIPMFPYMANPMMGTFSPQQQQALWQQQMQLFNLQQMQMMQMQQQGQRSPHAMPHMGMVMQPHMGMMAGPMTPLGMPTPMGHMMMPINTMAMMNPTEEGDGSNKPIQQSPQQPIQQQEAQAQLQQFQTPLQVQPQQESTVSTVDTTELGKIEAL